MKRCIIILFMIFFISNCTLRKINFKKQLILSLTEKGIVTAMACSDIDSDSNKELIIALSSARFGELSEVNKISAGYIYIYEYIDGNLNFEWKSLPLGYARSNRYYPEDITDMGIVSDLRDLEEETFIKNITVFISGVSRDFYLKFDSDKGKYIIRSTKKEIKPQKMDWEKDIPEFLNNNRISVADYYEYDIDRDGKEEMIVSGTFRETGLSEEELSESCIHIYKGIGNKRKLKWKSSIVYGISKSLVCDINNDNRNEIVAGNVNGQLFIFAGGKL